MWHNVNGLPAVVRINSSINLLHEKSMLRRNATSMVTILIFWSINLTHGYAIGSPDSVKRLLNALDVGEALSRSERTAYYRMLVDISIGTSMASGLAIGVIGDRFGPRVLSLIGIFCHAIPFCLWGASNFKAVHILAAVMLGIPAPAFTVAFISGGNLIPGYQATIIGFIGSGMCINAFSPLVMEQYVRGIGTFMCCMTVLIIACTFAGFALYYVPIKAFEESGAVPDVSLTTTPTIYKNASSTEENLRLLEAQKCSNITIEGRKWAAVDDTNDTCHLPIYHHLSLKQMFATTCFWIFNVHFVFSVFARMYFCQYVQEIYKEIGGKYSDKPGYSTEFYVQALNILMPMPFISLIMFVLFDFWGLYSVLSFFTGTMAVLFASCAFLRLSFQWISIVACCIVVSCLYGKTSVFLTSTYGVKHFGALQGVQNLTAVVGIFLVPLWVRFIGKYLNGSHTESCKVLVVISLLAFIPVASLHYRRQKALAKIKGRFL